MVSSARNDLLLSETAKEAIRVLQEVLRTHHRGLVKDHLRIAQLARQTALRLDLSDDEIIRIELAARLHDIGKIAIPETILRKPGPLTQKEWAIMRTHTAAGSRVIGAAPELADVAALVRSHCEHWDGGGYPDGLREERIPLGARIIAVCSSFVAMMRKRPYINAVTVVEALAELKRCSGTQFQPQVVEAFVEVFHELFE